MATRGLIVGKFAPLTRGHVTSMYRAAARVDELHVVLCYDEKFLQTVPHAMRARLSKCNRHLWLLETFAAQPNVHISVIDETPIGSFPGGSADFTVLVRNQLQEEFGDIAYTHVFSSEPDYNEYFATYFPEAVHEVIDADRALVPISATQVRENPYAHWADIAPAARKDFVQRVAIIGCESTGKSTLVRQLAEHYNTTYVPEVGRHICEDEYYNHEEYMYAEDYVAVAYAHNVAQRQALRRANRVLISDTSNIITEFSARCMGVESETLQHLSKVEQYDLVLYLDIDVPWVGDALRRNGDTLRRAETDQMLRELCVQRNVQNLQYVSGSYEQRFMQAIRAIDELLGGI